MHSIMAWTIAAASVAIMGATPRAVPAQPLTCATPVRAGESAAQLRQRFPGATRFETLPGAEGEDYRALVLWPTDPRRRLVVSFADEAMKRAESVTIGDPRSQWSVAGLMVGDPLSKLVTASGRAVTFYGFEWDYGGYVTNLDRGKLRKLEGGCTLAIRLNPGKGVRVPASVTGEAEISSNNPALARVKPAIGSIILNFPEQP